MARFTQLTVVLILMMLAGCAPVPSTTPTAPEIPTVHVSPFALPFAQSLGEQYIESHGALPFDLIPASGLAAYESVEAGQAALHLDFPPIPEEWFATPLGWEGIVVVVHPDVPIRSLSLDQLADVYSGRIDDWQEFGRGLGPIQPVIPPRGDSLRAAFLGQVMPAERVTTLARLSPSPREAVRITQETEGAISLVPAHMDLSEVDVSILRIEGQLPELESIEQGDYPLRVQIVATAPKEPTGEVRTWLSWAQASQ